jgi:SAM-dependent methyltransferase
VAEHEDNPVNLAYIAGAAERIPLADATCDLAWLSHVWHHIRDHQACVSELRRVLRPGSLVLVRGTFGDRLDGFPTLFRFWPAARAICEQLPTIRETLQVFETSGFVVVEHRHVRQQTAASLSEFAERTRARADSALVLISDSEFHQGQAVIETAAAAEREPVPVLEVIDFLVLRNGSTQIAA